MKRVRGPGQARSLAPCSRRLVTSRNFQITPTSEQTIQLLTSNQILEFSWVQSLFSVPVNQPTRLSTYLAQGTQGDLEKAHLPELKTL